MADKIEEKKLEGPSPSVFYDKITKREVRIQWSKDDPHMPSIIECFEGKKLRSRLVRRPSPDPYSMKHIDPHLPAAYTRGTYETFHDDGTLWELANIYMAPHPDLSRGFIKDREDWYFDGYYELYNEAGKTRQWGWYRDRGREFTKRTPYGYFSSTREEQYGLKKEFEARKEQIQQEIAERKRQEQEEQRKQEEKNRETIKIEEFREMVSDLVAKKEYQKVLQLLQARGLFRPEEKTSDAKFGRRFDISTAGHGDSFLNAINDTIALDMKELEDGTLAVGLIYEDRKWRSNWSTDSYAGTTGIGWYWRGNVTLIDLEKGCGPSNETGTICVRHPKDSSQDIFGNIPQKDFLSVADGKVTVNLGRYASASVDVSPEEKKPPKEVKKEEPKVAKTPVVKAKKRGILKTLDLATKARILDEDKDVAALRHEREDILAAATTGIKDPKKKNAVLRRINVQDLRDKESRARASKLGKLLKSKQADK